VRDAKASGVLLAEAESTPSNREIGRGLCGAKPGPN
jgi:hypothetical protein